MKKIISKIKKEKFKQTLLLDKKINFKEYKNKYFTCSSCETRFVSAYLYKMNRLHNCPVCRADMMTKSNLVKMEKVKENLVNLNKELNDLKEKSIKEDDRFRKLIRELKSNRTIDLYQVDNWSASSYGNEFATLSFRSSKYAQHESYGFGDDYEGDRDELYNEVSKIVKSHFKKEFKADVNYGEKEWFQLTLEGVK